MRRHVVLLVGITLIVATSADAQGPWGWNTPPKSINALAFAKSGRISFTLFDQGTSGPEFECATAGTDKQWLFVSPCAANDAACLASVGHMASLLLSAKVTARAVHVYRTGCEVTAVALKP